VNDLDIDPAALGVQIVVSGHSHKPSQTERAGVLYINPGSAGPRRFRLPVSIAKLDLTKRLWSAEFIDLKI
jgi:predicted phosphodiesterase